MGERVDTSYIHNFSWMRVSHNEIFSRCTSPFTSKIDLTWGSTLRFGILLLDYFLLRQTTRLNDCNHHIAFETKMDSSANTYNLVHSKHGHDHDHNDNSHGDHDGVVISMILTMIIMAMAMEPLVTTLVHSNHGLGIETLATRNFPTCSKHLICTM